MEPRHDTGGVLARCKATSVSDVAMTRNAKQAVSTWLMVRLDTRISECRVLVVLVSYV
jgi:hypothetical protein